MIGNNSINSGFGLEVIAEAGAKNAGAISAADLSDKTNINISGIDNKGSISTNKGRDIVRGTATAKIAAVAQTVSEAIAYADDLDTNAIAATFANIDINAIANGINNSGKINTGKGNDSVDAENESSVAAVATATADATAIVKGIAQAPMDESLTAFAAAIAQSLANATIIATGLNNSGGELFTAKGKDTITATATSDSATFAEASTSAFSAATPENQALALAVAEAVAKSQDKAIAIDNSKGIIDTGEGADTIRATANGADKAIAIENTNGTIQTGKGSDTIQADATGLESYGIFGGTIETGDGADKVEASSFGGGVNINMGDGKDFVEGFGNATVNGGKGFDILSLGFLKIDDFNISLGASNNNEVNFERDGIIMSTQNFEQFNFGNGNTIFTYDELVATV
ncbi:hypothetical protein IQ247_10870 [Plectonema cf. radiosum LEGE 06105]|uniref:Uncharacterized protein n=1 Tax=Plectonema cf. radiosum LEGE 06105 TaxID=945769 RepID=A0A8J7F388_9CYAN|nr:hypothetical protein [Plectonema cf. radiosum LEGE 06105]